MKKLLLVMFVLVLAACGEAISSYDSEHDHEHLGDTETRQQPLSLGFVPVLPFPPQGKSVFVSQCFGGSYSHSWPLQYGIDYVFPSGTQVLAVGDATVEYVSNFNCKESPGSGGPNEGCNSGYGNNIVLKHSSGVYSAYFHLLKGSARVKQGDKVRAGHIIALSGDSGFGSAPHLHFQFQNQSGRGVWTDYTSQPFYTNWYNNNSAQSQPPCPSSKQATSYTKAFSRGHWDYCSSEYRCHPGQGDCDSNSDCQYGLVCHHDVGSHYGLSSTVDFCDYPNASWIGPTGPNVSNCQHTGSNGGWSYCSSACPCTHGDGDCDNNSHCVTGTYCAHDVGAQYGFGSTVDVCVNLSQGPSQNSCTHSGSKGGWSYCSSSCPCGWGEGDCDNDRECKPGLSCKYNVGAQHGYSSGVDVCK